MSHVNSKCKPYGLVFSLLHIAWSYFLSADLNSDPVQYPNMSLGWGTVYLEVSAEEPGLDAITCTTLKYVFATDFLCNLRLNPFNFFFSSWFICLQVGMLWSFPKTLQSRPMRWQRVWFWVVLYRHRIKGACVWDQGAQSTGGGETTLLVKWFAHTRLGGLWQGRDWAQRISPL